MHILENVGIIFTFSFLCNFLVASYKYREEYIKVPVDHFSFTDNRTFLLRYFINDTFWEPNRGPIFFYPGNEGTVETFAKNTGFLWEIAVTFRALVIFSEHRFYGKSMPFQNKSYSDSQYYSYLTTQQAMADYVDLIYQIREQDKLNITSKKPHEIPNPVIAFGGSYGGMLAAWMRMKYPALIQGALASSAPIWYFSKFVPCDAFNKWLTQVFSSSNKHCPENIRQFWDELYHVAKSKNGRKWFSKKWNLCKPLEKLEDADVIRFMLESMFSAVGMVNYPYPTDFLKPLPANPVKAMCIHLQEPNMKGKKLLKAMSKVVLLYFNYKSTNKCLKWPASAYNGVGEDGWNIQTCMDMTMPFCSNGKTDMFLPQNWTFKDFDEFCYSNYKLHPDQNIAEKLYGGKNLDAASNIIFSNGLLDPWTSGGVTFYKNPWITTILLEDAAHHLDIRAAHPLDPHSVKRARKLYEIKFRQWIKDYYKNRGFF